MTDSDPITGIIVPCSSSSSREEESEADPSIYIRVLQKGDTYKWYAIGWKNSDTAEVYEFLHPVFPTPPKHQTFSSCGVVGSTIYVLGGADPRIFLKKEVQEVPPGSRFSHPLENDVYYLDTQNPSSGWKKGLSMLRPRANTHPVTTVDGKMFVFGNIVKGHNKEDGDVFLMGEVFDGNCWRPLSSPPPSLLGFTRMDGHAILDDHNRNSSKMILLHGRHDPGLYIYDIESDSWNIYSKSALGYKGMRSSALVDGVLYCMDHYFFPGVMFAVDVSNPEKEHQQVLGFDKCSIPQKAYDGGPAPKEFLFSLGKSKLAVVWSGSYFANRDYIAEKTAVCCSKFKMSKRRNDATGQYTFHAELLSLSRYCVMGYSLTNAVAV